MRALPEHYPKGTEKEVSIPWKKKNLTTAAGAPVPDNQNAITAGSLGRMQMQDVWYISTSESK